jgi:hypothetical protein
MECEKVIISGVNGVANWESIVRLGELQGVETPARPIIAERTRAVEARRLELAECGIEVEMGADLRGDAVVVTLARNEVAEKGTWPEPTDIVLTAGHAATTPVLPATSHRRQ